MAGDSVTDDPLDRSFVAFVLAVATAFDPSQERA